ncbi:hypothetical protein [Micrococcus sp. IITD107]|uniref:hypothetical protein n=1 Tax=Micrococcus sp. IITD107 TaxID=3342790 RepID=UPI0035B8B4BE
MASTRDNSFVGSPDDAPRRSRYRGAGPRLFWAQPLTPSGGMHMIVFALAGVLFLIGGWGA